MAHSYIKFMHFIFDFIDGNDYNGSRRLAEK